MNKEFIDELKTLQQHPHIWKLDKNDKDIEVCAVCELRKKKVFLTKDLWLYRYEKLPVD